MSTDALTNLQNTYSQIEAALRDLTAAISDYELRHGPLPLPPLSAEQRMDPRLANIVEATDRLVRAEARRDALNRDLSTEKVEQDGSTDGGKA